MLRRPNAMILTSTTSWARVPLMWLDLPEEQTEVLKCHSGESDIELFSFWDLNLFEFIVCRALARYEHWACKLSFKFRLKALSVVMPRVIGFMSPPVRCMIRGATLLFRLTVNDAYFLRLRSLEYHWCFLKVFSSSPRNAHFLHVREKWSTCSFVTIMAFEYSLDGVVNI